MFELLAIIGIFTVGFCMGRNYERNEWICPACDDFGLECDGSCRGVRGDDLDA